jgi:hypothetical protein
MLTKHNYNDINGNWDQETILDCCQKLPPDGSNCNDCCYDNWQAELKKVASDYYKAVELVLQYQNKLNFVTARRDRYKTWIDELVKAENLSADVCYQLKLIALQSDKIWFNSCKSVQAIEILFCMIRDIFNQIDNIKLIYDNLQSCITRVNDPSLIPNQGILQYLNDYKLKLDAVIKLRDDIIKSIVDAVRLSNLIRNNISTKDCPSPGDNYSPCPPNDEPCGSVEGEAYYGFKTIICEWYNAFACDVKCSDEPAPQSHGKWGRPGPAQQTAQPASEECVLEPTFDFPICNNTFKSEVEGWLQSDESLIKDLTDKLNKVKIDKETLLACKTSLDSAIKATDPALRCK